MKAIYNTRILDEAETDLQISNRAFCYGDGLFETIVTGPDRINLIPLHLARLSKACNLLDMVLPFDEQTLTQQITALKEANKLTGQTRTRVQVWRDTGGLYIPLKNSSSYLITIAQADKPFYSSIRQISVSKQAKVTWHALSFAKTMSAMPYVVAGLEKKQLAFDDLIITDANDNIAEAIVSNVFWTNQGEVFTPSLNTGCVDGTMRQHIIKQFARAQKPVSEVNRPVAHLLSADQVFLTNAAGIQWVEKFEDRAIYTNPEALLRQAAILPPQL